jgi:hypothetical protein
MGSERHEWPNPRLEEEEDEEEEECTDMKISSYILYV